MQIARRAALRPALGALVVALVSALALVATDGPADAYRPWGRLRAADRPLSAGCDTYAFRYRVDPPRDEWLAEMYVVSPDGVGLHHTVMDSEFHENRGRIRYTICKSSTRYGKHKLRMKITWYENDPADTKHTGWVRPSYFRLYRP